MKRTEVLPLAALVAGSVFILVLGNGALVGAQTPTSTPAPSPTSTTPTATPSPAALDYDQALTTYKEIATEVMRSAERILDLTKWVVAGIFSLIGVAGGAILYIARTAGQAKDSAARSAQAAEDSRVQLEKLEVQVQDALAQFRVYREELEIIKKQARSAQREVEQVVPRLETLANVDTYAMRLFGTNSKISQVAKRTLVELSRDDDPVVRRACVRVFGAMPDYPECFIDLQDPLIISRLREMALKDPERGVQLEARRTLEKFRVDLGEGA